MSGEAAFQWLIDRERWLDEKAHRVVYAEPPGARPLTMHVLAPEKDVARENAPALLFFYSGASGGAARLQFVPHALHYAARSAVCILVEHRMQDLARNVTLSDLLGEIRAAVGHARAAAEEWGFSSDRLVAVGAGVSAMLIAAVMLEIDSDRVKEEKPDLAMSRPDAGIILSSYFDHRGDGPALLESTEGDVREFSLFRHIHSGCPPLLIAQGNADHLVPIEIAWDFVDRMQKKGNPCRLIEFEGRARDFYQFNVDPVSYEALLGGIDHFLEEQHILPKSSLPEDTQVISWREGDF